MKLQYYNEINRLEEKLKAKNPDTSSMLIHCIVDGWLARYGLQGTVDMVDKGYRL